MPTCALARTYAVWDRLRGDDPYEHTRREMAALPQAPKEQGGTPLARTARLPPPAGTTPPAEGW
ncbi:hypothetical protein [Streptomyces sp. CA2R101]|uniref:hypothetical protein n=1 Tax=Streptomyces sp. CA2R101 TaxID=3120152 RepID=UPI003FA68E75